MTGVVAYFLTAGKLLNQNRCQVRKVQRAVMIEATGRQDRHAPTTEYSIMWYAYAGLLEVRSSGSMLIDSFRPSAALLYV